MFQLEVNMTQDEMHERLRIVREQGVSVSDHLRIALGMRPLGEPPFFPKPEPRGRLRLVHDRTRPERR
ncbi:MAG: hypothetical protein ABSB69_10000 [Solirubrobacteraceae bacterium]